MHSSLKRALAGALVVLALPLPLLAHAQAGLDVSLTARRVAVDARGKETFTPATEAKPGQLLEYRAAYKNASTAAVREVQATLPIPQGTEYVVSTARPTQPLASLDGRTYAALPLTRKVKLTNGQVVVKEIPVSEYRYLRWSLGAIAAGRTETVSARVRVSPLVAAAEPSGR
jgi:uncharacterized repeat protein (TIGR01451 family)